MHRMIDFYSSAVSKKDAKTANVVWEREHFSRSIMVSIGVSRMGKTSIIFVEPSTKINSQYYCDKLLGQGLLPDVCARCGRYKWTLQQDGAPSHTARDTVRYLQRNNVSVIEPDMWPPNSPDLNPVDYAVWGALQQLVYIEASVVEMKQAIVNAWQELSQSFMTEASTNGIVALSAWYIRMGPYRTFV